jgi:hypothetical protein
LRQAFIPWLAGVDPETDARKRRVARWQEIPTAAHPLLERLMAARLLIRDKRLIEGDAEESIIFEIAHEALLRQWPSLIVWLDEEAEQLKTTETVKRAAGEWNKHNRGGDWLTHTGERLGTAEALLQRPDFSQLLGKEGRDYLQACRKKDEAARAEREAQVKRIAEEQARVTKEQERTAKQQRWSYQLLVAIAAIVFLAGTWIVLQTREVARQTSLVLATAAGTASDRHNYDRALRFAILGTTTSWLSPAVPESEAQLARAAHASRHVATLGRTHRVSSAAFSPDGQRVLTASSDLTARVWDVHWLTQYHGPELIEAVCREKLRGVERITSQDVEVAPILRGRQNENVCP